jgi:DNA-binding MarR family transcriptional regulator
MPRRNPRSVPSADYVDQVLGEWTAERPDLAVDPVGIVYRVLRLGAYLSTEVERAFAGTGISNADFSVLAHLRRAGSPYQLTQRQLMDALSLTSGTVSARIDRLAARGLVRRDPDPKDGRGVLVGLTADGERVFDDLAPQHLANEAQLVAALSPDERAEFARLLQILLVDYETPAGGRPDEPLGLTVAPAHVSLRRRAAVGLRPIPGLLVEAVRPGGPGAAAGVQPGDVIVGCGGREARSMARLAEAVSKARVVLELRRADGSTATATIRTR